MASSSTTSGSFTTSSTTVPSSSSAGPSSSSAGPSSSGSATPIDIRALIKEAIREELRSASSMITSPGSSSIAGSPGLGTTLPLSFVELLPSSAEGPSASWSFPTATLAGSSGSAAGGVAATVTTSAVGTAASPIASLLASGSKPGSHPAVSFSLASSFPPIPAKLYAKARSLSFVEMKDLLPDNVAAAEQHSTSGRSLLQEPPRQREIASITTWVSAFATYIAMVAEEHPSRVKDMLAYLRLIVREAKRGNKGWISYDRIFRQNAATNPSTQWSSLDPSLHSSFCLGNEPPPTVCMLCNKLDHRSDDCALAKPTSANSTDRTERDKPLTSRYPSRPSPRGSKRSTSKICLSWNSGQCVLPGTCEYLHECHTCHEADHRARDRPLTPAESIFKRAKRSKLTPHSASSSMPKSS